MIVVTGLMRSGTSPLAQMLHRMGVTMGTYMRFPVQGPFAHLEWEDAAISDPLAAAMIGKTELDHEALFEEYIPTRRGRWGVKSPFLLPYLDLWRDVAHRRGHTVKVIVTERDYGDTLKSLERQASHLSGTERTSVFNACHQMQARLQAARQAVGDDAEVFHIQDTWNRPQEVAERLAEIAGVHVDIEHAIRGIGRV